MTSGFYHYARLLRNGSEYAQRMNRLGNRIFGEVARPIDIKSTKVVRLLESLPKYKDPNFVEYYPRYKETYYLFIGLRKVGLFRDEHEDVKEEMKRLRRLRGKGPPPKGQGKRAKVS